MRKLQTYYIGPRRIYENCPPDNRTCIFNTGIKGTVWENSAFTPDDRIGKLEEKLITFTPYDERLFCISVPVSEIQMVGIPDARL